MKSRVEHSIVLHQRAFHLQWADRPTRRNDDVVSAATVVEVSEDGKLAKVSPTIPADLQAAFRALYDDYRQQYHQVMNGSEGDDPDITPPVFIVVA